MITTILAAIALSGSLAPAAKPEFAAQTDYGQALKLAADGKKPMAVLIGKGDAFAKLMADAGLTAEAKKVLSEKFVCVTVDVTTDGGKALAGQFQLTDGLVISSAGGNLQALRQSGAVSAADLTRHTAAYANVGGTPATTVTAGQPVVTSTSGYTPAAVYPAGTAPTFSSCPNGNCGAVSAFPAASGCPNGNCAAPAPSRFFRR